MTQENELYWAAGFFDGEGTIGFYNGRGIIQVKQVDKEPLERFAKAIQIGKVAGPYAQQEENWQPQYQWQVQARRDVIRVAQLLLPLVSGNKRKQVEQCLATALAYEPKRGPDRKACKRGHPVTPENTYTNKQ